MQDALGTSRRFTRKVRYGISCLPMVYLHTFLGPAAEIMDDDETKMK